MQIWNKNHGGYCLEITRLERCFAARTKTGEACNMSIGETYLKVKEGYPRT